MSKKKTVEISKKDQKVPKKTTTKRQMVASVAIEQTVEQAELASGATVVESAAEQTETIEPNSKKETSATKAKKEPASSGKKPKRSQRYSEARSQVAKEKLYSLDEAIELVKKLSLSRYDGGVELHLNLRRKKTKGATESSRGLFQLPHGSAKKRKITILDEETIEQIAKTKKIDFDIALASPALMPKVAKIAKILGPKGKMPDPKTGTVTDDFQKTISEIESGKVEYRIDSGQTVHQLVGRVSWESNKLRDNIVAVCTTIGKPRLESAFLTASVSPSVRLDLNRL